MEKKREITVCMDALTEAHRQRLQDQAGRLGFTVRFVREADAKSAGARESEILLANGADLLSQAPKLRWFCASFAGVEHVLRCPDLRPDVLVSNSSGAYGTAIAEHIVMVTLMMLRRMPAYEEIVRGRAWIRNLPVRSLLGARILILGTGDIGHETAVRMRSFSPASIVGINRTGRADDTAFDVMLPLSELDRCLPETDILILCLPGTAATTRLIDERRLRLLSEAAYLVNVGRGATLDQAALVQALTAGRLAGAALDVFETEPVRADDPLWTCPNLLMTPHCSGNVSLAYTVDRIVELFLEDLQKYASGRPLERLVDRSQGY